MKRKSQKGFTLIELLAVIVILGVIMVIAIPSVTGYINNSRKDAMISTAREFINGARQMLISDNELPTPGTYVLIPTESIDLESGGSSPYTNQPFESDGNESYVLVYNSSGTYTYYVGLKDSKGNCLNLASEEYLEATQTRTKRKLVGTTCPTPIAGGASSVSAFKTPGSSVADATISWSAGELTEYAPEI